MIIVTVSVVMVLLLLGLNSWYKRKMNSVSEELILLKKEKEYYSEAIMVLSDSYDVIYANKTAKNLFGLNKSYQRMAHAKDIQLKIDTSYPDNFFKVLNNVTERKEDSFHLQNVLLVIDGKMTQVNIYVDKSEGNVNMDYDVILTYV